MTNHICDWCANKQEATVYREVCKKKRTGLIGTGIKWYACDQHQGVLSRMSDMLPIKRISNDEEVKMES